MNDKFKYLLFDLDGTLTDPFEGITKSFQYALEYYGIKEEQKNLLKVIGPPLIDSFMKYYGFDEKKGWDAVEKYRERFSVTGWQENRLLEGIDVMLDKVKNADKVIALATAKPFVFSDKILKKYGIDKYFDLKCGTELRGGISNKTQVIEKLLEDLKNPKLDEVLMIGDRKDDVDGAKNNGIKCLGVKYGYAEENELENAGADYIVDSIDELTEFLLIH